MSVIHMVSFDRDKGVLADLEPADLRVLQHALQNDTPRSVDHLNRRRHLLDLFERILDELSNPAP